MVIFVLLYNITYIDQSSLHNTYEKGDKVIVEEKFYPIQEVIVYEK